MSNFFDRFTGRKTASPAQSAKERLKLVLTTDRINISPEDLRNMQNEIIDVIRKYCRINEEHVEVKFEQRERDNFLVANIPLQPSKPGEPPGSVQIETTLFELDDEDEDEKEEEEEDDKDDNQPTAAPQETSPKNEKPQDDTANPGQDASVASVKGAPTGFHADEETTQPITPVDAPDNQKKDD